jgi:hypothetical protein
MDAGIARLEFLGARLDDLAEEANRVGSVCFTGPIFLSWVSFDPSASDPWYSAGVHFPRLSA